MLCCASRWRANSGCVYDRLLDLTTCTRLLLFSKVDGHYTIYFLHILRRLPAIGSNSGGMLLVMRRHGLLRSFEICV